jgi:hypothetical protein
LQPSGVVAGHDKAGPLRGWLLHKGPVFRSASNAFGNSLDRAWDKPLSLSAEKAACGRKQQRRQFAAAKPVSLAASACAQYW